MSEKAEETFDSNHAALRLKNASGSEDVHYPVFYEGIPDEYRFTAEQTLGETAAKREKGLRKLKEFMKKENLSATDEMLTIVLRACKYDRKKSEKKLKKFLRFRRNVIEKLCQMDSEKMDLIIEHTIFSVLPYRDKYGRTIILSKPTVDFDKYTMDDVLPVAFSLILYLLTFPMSTVCGFSYIGDCKADSVVILYNVLKGYKGVLYSLEDMPIRLGRIDITNENLIVRLFYNAVHPILPDKVTKRLFLNGSSYKELHSTHALDILPKNFDGNMESINCKVYKERLIKFIQTLKEEGQKLGYLAT